MTRPLNEEQVKRYAENIYQSFITCSNPQWAAALSYRHLATQSGSPEWLEATRQAIARFEARGVAKS